MTTIHVATTIHNTLWPYTMGEGEGGDDVGLPHIISLESACRRALMVPQMVPQMVDDDGCVTAVNCRANASAVFIAAATTRSDLPLSYAADSATVEECRIATAADFKTSLPCSPSFIQVMKLERQSYRPG